MRFRWICLLTLWTFLSGPMLALPIKAERPADVRSLRRPAVSAQLSLRCDNSPRTGVFALQAE